MIIFTAFFRRKRSQEVPEQQRLVSEVVLLDGRNAIECGVTRLAPKR
jgi:hypothetical protein